MGIIVYASLLVHVLMVSISLIRADNCYDTGNFSARSTYANNRDLLLSSLASNVTANGGFYNTTIGQYDDKVYGLVLCISDPSEEFCSSCVDSAIQGLIEACPNQKEAISWGGVPVPCIVRYANRPILGKLELSPTDSGSSTGDLESNLTDFDQIWTSLMNETVARASTGSSMLKMAAGEADLTSSKKIYVLMQCTPDISQRNCSYCLQNTVTEFRSCCFGQQGGYVENPSCFLRWDLFPFYNVFSESPRQPPPAASVINSPSPTNTTSTISKAKGNKSSRKVVVIIVPASIFTAVVVLACTAFYLRKPKQEVKLQRILEDDYSNEDMHGEVTSKDLPLIRLDVIHEATKQFSNENKLGQGGFGPVYMGTLKDGKEVAVKRLSKTSGQGQREFLNEVILIAKLQHRNLVRLLGCCLEKNEKLLIYEYMPNKSLDVFLFASSTRVLIDWQRRLSIINGIARGLLYLHEDSRLRIIHRDLKTSNILLDYEMNPKISDFGMARIFGGNQSEANTNRIVGTYGYMAPEYAMAGHFSVKSDVFSFGVLVLEIISGKRSAGFHFSEEGESLLTFAWKLWCKGEGLELMDPMLEKSYVATEVLKCIHIGLLCVQEDPADRPTMSSVLFMLASDTIALPIPREPAFSIGRTVANEAQPSNQKVCSTNELTLSVLSPR